jgi:hypothetical protein
MLLLLCCSLALLQPRLTSGLSEQRVKLYLDRFGYTREQELVTIIEYPAECYTELVPFN